MPRSARKASAASTKKVATAKKKATSAAVASKKIKQRRNTNRRSETDEDEEDEADGEDESEEEEEEESTIIVERPRKRTKRETATVKKSSSKKKKTNTTKQSSHRSKSSKKKGNGGDDDDEEDETMEEPEVKENGEDEEEEEAPSHDDSDEYDHGPLTAITAKKYGHIFVSKRAKERANLPLVVVHMMCDTLPLKSLFSLARVSRASYVMVREYGELVVVSESKRSVTSDPLGDDIEFMSSAVGSVNPNPPRRLGQRSMKECDTFQLREDNWRLIYSQLRHLLTSISLACQLEIVGEVSYALPYLRQLILPNIKSKRTKVVVFPQYLRSVSVQFDLFTSGTTVREKYVAQVATALGELEYLNEFRLTNSYNLHLTGGNAWTKLIAHGPRLRLFFSSIPDLISTTEQLQEFSSNFISLVQRGYNHSSSDLTEALRDTAVLASSAGKQQLQLQNFDCGLQLNNEFVDSLKPFASTLTYLNPAGWLTPQVSWLSEFTQLRVLTINTSASERIGYYGTHENWTATEGVTFVSIVMEDLVNALCELTHLTRLRLFVHRLENDHLERILKSLISLQHLSVGSNEVTSIACISQLPHLMHQLKALIMRLPKLPRDEVVHLDSLRWLSQLDIAGSFAEPLYIRQLFHLRSPSQRHPYLKKFVPRSSNEAVPIPPVDLVAQAQQRIEFDVRVRTGAVCAAEMMNSDQLSLILQQLDCKEFSFAARTCRSWRSAASQKNAWSSGITGRKLVLEGDAPECLPSILPLLPLWRHARRVLFYVDRQLHSRSRDLVHRTSAEEPLAVVTALTRLESLELHCPTRYYSSSTDVSSSLTSFLSQIESRLTFLHVETLINSHRNVICLAPDLLHSFTHLRTLELKLAVGQVLNFSTMTMLHTVKLMSCLPTGSGDALRRLSLEHQLRCVTLSLLPGQMNHLQQFMNELTDRSLVPAIDGTAIRHPAAITQFHLHLASPSTLAPLDLLFDLQQLTDLHIEVTPGLGHTYVAGQYTSLPTPLTPWNFAQIPQKNAFLQLERFKYSGPIDPTQLVHLAHMKQLRSVSLADAWHLFHTGKPVYSSHHRSWSRPNENSVPVGCIKQWMESWLQLEEFHLEGLQVIGSELKELARAAKYLRRFGLHHVSTTTTPPLSVHDFDFLSECKKLESIELKCVLGLTLTPRHTWFDGTSSVLVQQRSNDEDGDIEMKSDIPVVDSSPSSSSSLVDTLRACPELNQFLWCLHPTDLNASVEFTQSNAKFGRQSIPDRRGREWARERYTLKTRLRPSRNSTAIADSTTSSSVFISYLSCCETIKTLQHRIQIELIGAEEKLVVSSSQPIDAKDNDLIRHLNEIQTMEKKTARASKKRKVAESLTDE